jgi:hypothetical protein
MKSMDRFSDTLVAAVQLCPNLLWGFLLMAGQEYLTAAQGEGIAGAKSLF